MPVPALAYLIAPITLTFGYDGNTHVNAGYDASPLSAILSPLPMFACDEQTQTAVSYDYDRKVES